MIIFTNLIFIKWKRLLFLILVLSFTICSSEDCLSETDQSKCTKTEVEINGLSCYKIKYPYSLSQKCHLFPSKSENQKNFFNFINGIIKEIYSAYPKSENEDSLDEIEFDQTLKETYGSEEIIETKIVKMSNADQKTMLSENTCNYHFYGKSYQDNFSTIHEIEDKNICFNADQFEDLKDLLDCGSAKMSFTLGGKTYTMDTCYYIPNDKMPKEYEGYFKKYVVDNSFKDDGELYYLSRYLESRELYGLPNKEDERRLSAESYEITVENKNGKIMKISSEKDEIEIISEGKENEKAEKSSKPEKSAKSVAEFNFKLNIYSLLLFFLFLI